MARMGVLRRRLVLSCLLIVLGVVAGAASASGSVGSSPWDAAASPIADSSTWASDPVWQRAQAEALAREAAQQAGSTPIARAQSATQFDDLSRSEAQDLAQQTFPDLMAAPLDALGLPAGDHVTSYVSATTAQVEDPHGKRLLLESTEPFATKDDDSGQLSKVDLSLSAEGGALVPDNPVVEVELPDGAADPLTLPDSGLSVSLVDGADVAGRVEDDRVFYGEVSTDTDYITVPRRDGAQVMWQLRSPQATESPSLDLGLPAGETARLTSALTGAVSSDESPSVQIVAADGTVVDSIDAPSAIDADGVPLPTRYRLDGDRLYVDVPHREQQVKYPVLVDPEVREVWGGNDWWNTGAGTSGSTAGQWHFTATEGRLGTPWYIANNVSPAGPGMALESWSTTYLFTAGGGAYLWWPAPANARIASVWFDGLYHRTEGDHLFAGVIGPSGWETVYNIYGDIDYDQSSQTQTPGEDGSSVVFGTFEDMTTVHPVPGWAAVRGLNVLVGDRHAPDDVHISLATYNGQDFGYIPASADGITRIPWVNSATDIRYQTVAHDIGLGLRDIGIEDSANNWFGSAWHSGCLGNRASPCPASVVWTQTLPDRLGYTDIHAAALDIADNPTFSPTYRLRIDGDSPNISLSGQVVDHAHDNTLGPRATLHVGITDGNATSASSFQSGVRRVLVLIDGAALSSWTNPNTDATNNDFGWDYSLPVGTNGRHTVHITAWDDARNPPRTADLTFDSNPYPTSVQFGGGNLTVDTTTELQSLQAALENADDQAFGSLWDGLSPADQARFSDFTVNGPQPPFPTGGAVVGEADQGDGSASTFPSDPTAPSYPMGPCEGAASNDGPLAPSLPATTLLQTNPVYDFIAPDGRRVAMIRVTVTLNSFYRHGSYSVAVHALAEERVPGQIQERTVNSSTAKRGALPYTVSANIPVFFGQRLYIAARSTFRVSLQVGGGRITWTGAQVPGLDTGSKWVDCIA
jgi:hypothetical protein